MSSPVDGISLAQTYSSYENATFVSSVNEFVADVEETTRKLLSSEEPISLIEFAQRCILKFVYSNWSSPVLADQHEVSQTFGIDGCNLPPFTKDPQLLLVAKGIFGALEKSHVSDPMNTWMQIRSVGVYQWLLDDPSPTLQSELERLIRLAQSDVRFHELFKSRRLEMAFFLECYHYLRAANARGFANECLERASGISGIKISFAAALGKRTRYQTENIAQLYVKVDQEISENEGDPSCLINSKLLPSNLSIEDDAYLNEIKFENPESASTTTLSPISQALVLAKCVQYADSLPKEDNFLKEEVAAFLHSILKNPMNWAIQYHALYLRSVWEQLGSSSRKLDRSLRQLDHLSSVDAFKIFEDKNIEKMEAFTCHGNDLPCFFAALPPAPWSVQNALGVLLTRLGCTASALEIFERLHSWTDVIAGYTRLERREKAENLIKQQLSKVETPEMYVYLGDCTGDQKHYEKAWELSSGRCSKAQRNLGFLLAQKKEFDAAAAAFSKCLAINPLQNAVWFAYGCVGFALQNCEMAASGFYKCTQLDSENGEAWSNLATAYIKLGQKIRAVTILQEAIRCQFDNWRLWENFLLVTLDCGVFDESIRAVHRLIDLRGKFADAEVLEIISKAICQNIDDVNGQPSSKHRPAFLELVARILASSSPGAKISRYHADVILASKETQTEDLYKAISSLQRAIRLNLTAPMSNWQDKEFEEALDALENSLLLHNTFVTYASTAGSTEVDSLRTSLKYMFSQVLSRVDIFIRDTMRPADESGSKYDLILEKNNILKEASKSYGLV